MPGADRGEYLRLTAGHRRRLLPARPAVHAAVSPPEVSIPYSAQGFAHDTNAITGCLPAAKVLPPSVLFATPSAVAAGTVSGALGLTAMSSAWSRARSSQATAHEVIRAAI